MSNAAARFNARAAQRWRVKPADFGARDWSDLVAIRRWQSAHGCKVDGLVGKETVSALLASRGPAPGQYTVKGVDVSGWQQPHNDFGAARAAGYRWCCVKLTEGTHYRSTDALTQAPEAAAAGLVAGGYHFPGRIGARLAGGRRKPRTFATPDKEAAAYLRYAERLSTELRFHVLDGEAGIKSRWPRRRKVHTANARWWLAWIQAVQCATETLPWLYTARWAINAYIRHADPGVLRELAAYPLWLADYHPLDVTAPQDDPAPWTTAQVWQRSGDATVPGLAGEVDDNRMREDFWEELTR